MIDGVLFDFSGTLFRFEPGGGWPSVRSDEPTRERLVSVLTAPHMDDELVPPDLRDAWARRDLDPDLHRTVYLGMLAASGVALSEEESEEVYLSLTDPEAWHPYPDTEDVLKGLRAAGVPVAVVSNIAWDIRTVFRRHGVEDLVDEFVLSYVEGVVKPDAEIFRIACRRIGVAPERARMIGDSVEADGGAAAVGIDFVNVEPLPTEQRPSALRRSVSELLPTVEG
jgi:HAD superfamily hydrolase (TIGR01549 family)